MGDASRPIGPGVDMEDEQTPRMTGPALGEDLYGLSVAELEDRLNALEAEAERVRKELSDKRTGMKAANEIFGA